MAAESCQKRLQEEVTCSACLDYFIDPVILDCGHNVCRACTAQSWGRLSLRSAACPLCNARVHASSLRPNRQLANVVEIVKELSALPRPEPGGRDVCEQPLEPLKLFCQEDRAPICLACDTSLEHAAHRVVPVEEAAKEYQDQIFNFLETLRKERGTILEYKAENEKETQELLEQMAPEREKTTAAFRRLQWCLEEEEERLLAHMDEVGKAIARRKDENQARFSGELSTLAGLIQELEEKQEQSARELLQNIGNTLERCKRKSFVKTAAFPLDLKWRVHDFCDINPFLEAIMKQFQDSLTSGLQLQEVCVTLDPDVAHPELILSEDYKGVKWGVECGELPCSPERFGVYPYVLGCERFTAGRHFWEVIVGSGGEWAVGVARQPLRKGKFPFSPEEGVWAVGKWGGEYCVFNPPDFTLLPLSQELKRIRVTLNCLAGRVAFFDAVTGAQLYVYSETPSFQEAFLPLFFLAGKAHLTLTP